jgi:hypothetical protein
VEANHRLVSPTAIRLLHHLARSTLKVKPAQLHQEVAGVEEAVEVEVEEVQAVSTYSKTSSGTDLDAR